MLTYNLNPDVGLSNYTRGTLRAVIKGQENKKYKTQDQDILLVEFPTQTGTLGLTNCNGINNIIPLIKYDEYKSVNKLKLTRSN